MNNHLKNIPAISNTREKRKRQAFRVGGGGGGGKGQKLCGLNYFGNVKCSSWTMRGELGCCLSYLNINSEIVVNIGHCKSDY